MLFERCLRPEKRRPLHTPVPRLRSSTPQIPIRSTHGEPYPDQTAEGPQAIETYANRSPARDSTAVTATPPLHDDNHHEIRDAPRLRGYALTGTGAAIPVRDAPPPAGLHHNDPPDKRPDTRCPPSAGLHLFHTADALRELGCPPPAGLHRWARTCTQTGRRCPRLRGYTEIAKACNQEPDDAPRLRGYTPLHPALAQLQVDTPACGATPGGISPLSWLS